MYVCVCSAVTEKDIRSAAADGCRSMRQLREELGVASQCGSCAKHAHKVLRDSAACHPLRPCPAQRESAPALVAA